jgi:hypothetical protein
MATLQGKAVKNTYRQVLQIGANNVGVSGTLQPVQDGGGINTALSLSTTAATVTGDLTITGDLIITGGGIQIQDLIDDTVATLIQNGTGITWAYNDTLRTLTPTITIATADGGVQGDYMQFNVNAGEASAVGKLKWNTTDGTLDLGLMGGQVILQIGQEQVARVLNNSGSILQEAAYQVVKVASAQGQRLAVALAQANNDANSADTLGLVTENIANNQEGFVTTSGLVRNIDTTGDLQLEDWNDGDVLYLSPTTPGAITKVKPVAPQHTVIVGFVVYAHKTQGKIFVKVDNGYEIDELHNVKITSVANNNVLRYNSSLAVWENVAPLTTWITEGTNLYYTQGRFDSAFAAKSTTNLLEGTNLYWTTARGNVNFATNLAASTTTNLAEGTNLYFTNQRFDSRFGTKTTTDLTEGTNLYYTQARFNTAFDAKTTTDLDEGTNLYYTDARARLALASSATGLSYANNSGIFSLTAGYAIPTTVKLGEYDIAYNRSIVSAAVTGTSTKTLSLTQQDANVITASWTDQGITTINGTANQIAASTVGNTTTVGFTNDVTFPNNVVVSGNLTINGTATYVNTQSISSKDPLFEVANDNNTTDAVDIGYYGRYFDSAQTRVEFTGLFRDASDAGKFKFFTGLVDEPTNVVDTTGTGYTVGTLVANVEGNLAGTANAANVLSTARTISATGDAAWSVSFDGSANATAALTLANTGVTATTYGTTTAVPTIAVDSKGRITSASNTNIAFPVTTVNGQAGTVVLTTSNIAEGSNQYFTSARAQAAISGTAPISVASGVVSISQSGTATNGFLSSTDWNTFNSKSPAAGSTSITTLGTITTGIWNGTAIAIANGGTGSTTQNFVDLTNTQTIGGAKTFTSALNGTSATFTNNVTAGSIFQNTYHYFRSYLGSGTQQIGIIGSNNEVNGGYVKIINDSAVAGQRGIRLGLNGNGVTPGSGTDILTILDDFSSTFSGALIGTTATFSNILTINSNDQSQSRVRIKNTGTSGGDYAWVAGLNNVGNAGFSLLDISNNATRLYVSPTGSFGIGTTSPGYTATSRQVLAIDGGAGAGQGSILAFMQGGVNKGYLFSIQNDMELWCESGAIRIGTAASSDISLKTQNTDRLVISSNGNATFSNSIITPSSYGKSYSQTSTNVTVSIVDTGIYFNTAITGFANNSIYNLVVSGNPNAGGSNEYRGVYLGYIYVTTGYDFGIGNVVQRIAYTQLVTGDPLNIGALTITAVFWNGSTESNQQVNGTTNNQIRIKVSGYNPVNPGAAQTVLITKVN